MDYARRQMVEQQVRTWAVFDRAVLDVLAELPREDFVPAGFEELAFAETAIPLSHGQFMLPPTVEGRLLQALEPGPGDTVLEIGTGSGF
ncbi:MAG TPA: protein-L-isoaspartate O-methyltransferase, partial [Woeseiaceae bacterium]